MMMVIMTIIYSDEDDVYGDDDDDNDNDDHDHHDRSLG